MVVAVCVYNRFHNIKTWIKCWKQCDTGDAQLVIVHNHYGDEVQRKRFEDYCTENGITYVPRNGPGFDIGAMQDVFRGRLAGFPDFDYLLWNCDDTLPMAKDFVQQFTRAMKPGVGVACMQISTSVNPHVRTTGFIISKQTASKIKFPADPVSTKHHCYFFEHRGGDKSMTNQVRAMGLSCIMVSPTNVSPLWDSFHPNISRRLDRQAEFNTVWGIENGDKVVFICPIFEMYPQIISSLICQTHKNWELILIHNGPLTREYDIPKDDRIKFIINPEQTGRWGHPLRQWALNELANDRLSDGDYVVITNADNYHTPTYCDYLLKGFRKNPLAKAVYCDNMVHNYKDWQVIPCSPQRGYIDCAGVMVRKSVACEVGWRDMEGHSSDWTYFSDIISRYGMKSFEKVRGCLIVHN